ncbi:MAG TPA: HAMP domain-containing protein [Desulfobacterales bacterium]|nr:HAMP domain-containing protein [Desulfobacterales bacterium]
MGSYLEAERRDLKRRRRERYVIFSLLLLISSLTYLGTRILDLGLNLPFSSSILVFALINLNVILLLLLLFLTVRNLVKLLFERRKGIMGAKLRTKLVLAFVSLSLLPTVIIFFVSVQFISSSIEYWFNLQIEQSLKNSLQVGQDYYSQVSDQVLSFGNSLSRVITFEGLMLVSKKDELDRFIEEKRKEYRLASVKIFSKKLELRSQTLDKNLDLSPFEDPGADFLREVLEKGTDNRVLQSSPHGELVVGVVPIFSRTESKAVVGVLTLSKFIPGSFVNRLKAVSAGLQEYRQLKMLKKPIKLSHMITLSIVTFLVIFSAIWFGFYLSQGITVPIRELAEGTKRIASGDYNIFIDLEARDEIGTLVYSFNKMAEDLRTSKAQLEKANEELLRSNLELEQRRLYMEIVLANVAAGVISADRDGRILTINRSAEKILELDTSKVLGRNYKEVLPADYVKLIDEILSDKGFFRKGSLRKEIRVAIGNKALTLLVSLNMLRDDKGKNIGFVAVIEDLSEIEKAQRMAAWREVARRIAHEVKNPLTPIQLSAQRLKKRYRGVLDRENGRIFDECTTMIIRQVEELKRLVDEFSNFARMPAANPVPSDIKEIINETVLLYREAHKDINISFSHDQDVPIFNLDREQMKRVMINLLDNAVAAVDGAGEIQIQLSYNQTLQMVRIEVIDNGKGIPAEHRDRLFEPYFSTKKHGTGLGLAIVNTIVTDHNGFIRIFDNKPKGTRVVIELPVRR